jgi:hypothetical protein
MPTLPPLPSRFPLQASGAAKYAYDQAAGLKNAAGQSWDEAMQGAYKGWEGTKKSTQQTWDDVSVGGVGV